MKLDEVVARIRPADSQAKQAAMQRQLRLTKPPGSLGRLEDVSIQLAGIFGSERPIARNTTLIVAAADHGVVAQGVTGYPQAVTAQMVLNFLAGGAAISVMARTRGIELLIADAGIARPLPAHRDLRVVAPGRGTCDMTKGPAMTRVQAESCIRAGVDLAVSRRRARRPHHRHQRHGHWEYDLSQRNHGRPNREVASTDHRARHGSKRLRA